MDVIYANMMIYGYEADRRNWTVHDETLVQLKQDFPQGWPSGEYGMAVTKSLSEETRIKNPLSETSRGYSFEVAATASARATERYGKWSNEEECRALKETLVELDREGSGRGRLTDFYWKVPVGNNWFFEETPEYLRELGVLDESFSSRGMQLVIPNYVQFASNCIEVSAFYAICCLKECDSLLGVIERAIQAPMASPNRILPVVQRLLNAREVEARNVTTQLVAQLEAVAEVHSGEVPLHGRLFAQWLHYAFPYECPYPQKSDAVVTSVISEYSNRTGLPSVLSAQEMKKFIEEHQVDEEEEQEPQPLEKWSQWSMEEDLYVSYHHQGPRAGGRGSLTWSLLGGLVKLGIVSGGFVGLKKPFSNVYMNLMNSHLSGYSAKVLVCV